MKINTKYSISDKVYIKELKIKGKIIGIYIDKSGIEFNIRYFSEFKPSTCYFQEDDIQLEEPEKLGFKNA